MGVAGIPDWEPREPHAAQRRLWRNPRFQTLITALITLGLLAGLGYAIWHADGILEWLYR